MRISNLPTKFLPMSWDAQGRSGEVIDLVERVRFEIAISYNSKRMSPKWISESQLAEYSSLFIEHDNNNRFLLVSKSFLHINE